MNQQRKVQQWLKELATLRAKQEELEAQKQAEMKRAIPKPVQKKLEGIEQEYFGKIDGIASKAKKMEVEIKESVVALGETVQGEELYAVYNNGRVAWDDVALEGYMKTHPEIRDFRKEGKPSVTIRKAPSA